ncbi:MAG: hypothetical protein CM15mP103_01380 [Gammaproteobacteria bacterium]|nr:MAG: hypothetical protein CM15mP103_01380 [Gammaproteobacteria bacterium]
MNCSVLLPALYVFRWSSLGCGGLVVILIWVVAGYVIPRCSAKCGEKKTGGKTRFVTAKKSSS